MGIVRDRLERLDRKQHVEQLRREAAAPGSPPQLLHDEGDQEEFQAAEIPKGLEGVSKPGRRGTSQGRVKEVLVSGCSQWQIESVLDFFSYQLGWHIAEHQLIPMPHAQVELRGTTDRRSDVDRVCEFRPAVLGQAL